ncbi:MAG: O-antigen ligase family protein [Bacteroides xylanisolvens]
MLSLFLTIMMLLLLLKNYRKGIMLTAFVIQPLTYIGSGLGNVSLYYILAGIALIMFLFYSEQLKPFKYPKLLLISTSLMSISYLITNSLCNHPNTIMIIGNIITQFVFPFILWCVISRKKDVDFSINCLKWMWIVTIVVMILEQIFRHNYFTDIVEFSFKTCDFVIDANTIRYGLKRTNSIFSYFSTCGVFCSLSTFIIWIIVSKLHIKDNIYIFLLFIIPFVAFSTGSRAILLAVCVILLGVFTDRNIVKSKLYKTILFSCIILTPILIGYVSKIVDSVVNSNESSGVEGSTSDLRLLQWEACLPSFLDSPIWGNGRMYIWDVVAPRHSILQGAESLWFSLLVDYGIMGGITYLFMIFSCIIILYKLDARLTYLPIAYFLILCLSPDAGIQYNQLLTFVVLAIKMMETKSLYNKTT